MAPESRGQVWEERLELNPGRAERFPPFERALQGSEPGIRKLTIADREAGMSHQQAIDGDHHAAEQRGRRHEVERGGLGHQCPQIVLQQVAAVFAGPI
jgi:hypothetical protein